MFAKLPRTGSAVLILGLAIITTTSLFAHEVGRHLLGDVQSFDATSLTIVTNHNETITLKLLPSTRFIANTGQKASREGLRIGAHVVVHAKRNGTDWEADEVDGSVLQQR